MEKFFEIQLDNGAKYCAKGDDSLNIKVGDYCVIRKDFYLDYGQVIREMRTVAAASAGGADGSAPEQAAPSQVPSQPQPNIPGRSTEIPRIQRKATVVDSGKANENLIRTKSVLRTTQMHVDRLGLPMKLVNAHNSFDCKMITIQFSSEGRVDFRELVKQLSHDLNARIELRQIGVRDETALVGGISVCGRPLCCCQFLKEFASINVKMAKEQDLALTPSSISGICGRLKCCLKYEHEGYLELEKTMPRRGDTCECAEGRGRIVDRNLLTQKVVVQLEDSARNVTCSKDDVRIVYPDRYKMAHEQGGKDGGNAGRETNGGKDFSRRPDRRNDGRQNSNSQQQGGGRNTFGANGGRSMKNA